MKAQDSRDHIRQRDGQGHKPAEPHVPEDCLKLPQFTLGLGKQCAFAAEAIHGPFLLEGPENTLNGPQRM
jgi:hypothetical protein